MTALPRPGRPTGPTGPRRRYGPYEATDAIASAARYLHAPLEHAGGDVAAAIYAYNHSSAYVDDVLARARAYSALPETALTARTGERCTAGTGLSVRKDL